jgi:Ca2+-binding RTX toxin-like protein
MGPNNRYFVDQNGVPFLVNGDSPQALLVNLSPSDMNLYLTTRESQGFNTIIVDVLADTSTGGNTNGTTYDGIAPFTSGSSPSNYDLSTPNPTYFARLDALVSMAAADGFLVFLDPIETIGWLQTLQNNGTSKAFDFGVFLGNHYKNYPNVAWQSGNDFQSWTNTSDSDLVYQVMAGIKSVAPSQIQTIELSYVTSYSNQDAVTLPAINMDAAYTYHETYDMMLQAFNSSPTSPVFLVEGNYEGENNGFSFPGVTGTFILRAQEYWTMTSGGVGQFYGNALDWRFASGWQSTLDSAGVAQLPYWTALFTSVQWWKLVPDQNHQIVTAGYGTYNADNDNFYSSDYATTAWNPDGTTSVTYDIAGSALTVDLAKFAGPVSAQWYDPSDGTYQSVTGSPFANTSPWVFQPPGQNQEGYNDWVLVLRVETTDLVQTPLGSFTLPANVENLTHIGSADFIGIGNSLNNVMIGGAGKDYLIGLAGNDTLIDGSGLNTFQGGTGDDIYAVQSKTDTVFEFADEGTDQVQTFLPSYTLTANVENLTHTGSADFTGIGNSLNNVIIGGAGNDYLIGLAGNDTLIDGSGLNTFQGGTGNDIYAVQSNTDTVFEFADEGTDEVQTFLPSYTLTANVEKLTFVGATSHTGTGNSLANTFTGASGNDVFTGAGGHDTFNFQSPVNGFDTINDFNANNANAADHDIIDLTGRGLSFVSLSLTTVSEGVVVGIPGGDAIFLKNVAIGALDSGDFFF